ncbi:unnamed protein product [Clonostachys rosea]|uniref:Aspartate aminotransferase n=1 Tax=Bionectria ochroleuca TaxID=29856 RepID=A0ABY6TS60_BIOOC|nr:unnamed protein product [Clonostachys rosea]
MTISTGNGEGHSLLSAVPPSAAGGPFTLEAEFQRDLDPRKVNLIIGAYRDDWARPWQLRAVAEAKKQLKVESSFHEYLPLQGSSEFIKSAKRLIFGDNIVNEMSESIASIQTVSGTGANSLIAKFLDKHTRCNNIWLPDPTWVNHKDIWEVNAPRILMRCYPYYSDSIHALDFDQMLHILTNEAQQGDAILLHACAHNPTGQDPTEEQWNKIARLCQAKKLFVIFDSAYQGFASGDLDRDAWAVRHFTSFSDLEIAVCQSFSKNLGLYGERVGALHVVMTRSPHTTAIHVQDRLVDLHRAFVSMAPLFGCRVANHIFQNQELQDMWHADLTTMSGRISSMRNALYSELLRLRTPGDWAHAKNQVGMFSYTGLTKEEVEVLRTKYHIYMLPSGRASVCGLTNANVKYVAQAIHNVVTGKDSKKTPGNRDDQ